MSGVELVSETAAGKQVGAMDAMMRGLALDKRIPFYGREVGREAAPVLGSITPGYWLGLPDEAKARFLTVAYRHGDTLEKMETERK